jgi:hypothetical protein
MKKAAIGTHEKDVFIEKIHKKQQWPYRLVNILKYFVIPYINKSIMVIWIAKYTKILCYTLYK